MWSPVAPTSGKPHGATGPKLKKEVVVGGGCAGVPVNPKDQEKDPDSLLVSGVGNHKHFPGI